MSLYPTPTRLALLADVAYGEITRDGDGDSWNARHYKMTSRIEELEQAGWVELASATSDMLPVWRLTDAGTGVLAAAVTS